MLPTWLRRTTTAPAIVSARRLVAATGSDMAHTLLVSARNLLLPIPDIIYYRAKGLRRTVSSLPVAAEQTSHQRAAELNDQRLRTYRSWLLKQIRCALEECEKEFSAKFPCPTLPKYVDKLHPWRIDPPWPESEIPTEFHAACAAWQLRRTEWLLTHAPSLLLAAEKHFDGARPLTVEIALLQAALADCGRSTKMELSDEARELMSDIGNTLADAGNGGGGFQEGDSRAIALNRSFDELLAAVELFDSKGVSGCDRKLRMAIEYAHATLLGHF
jgi:hypothetical protein